jgi:heptosyltransferase-1
VIHTLPAITDAAHAIPGIRFDWVVEEGFAEIPSWHPAVDQVIPVAIRRWRKNIWQTLKSGEWKAFKQRVRARKYDLVIDAQGLVKSAWLTRYVKAPVAGLDRYSAREGLASRFYDRRLSVATGQHAVERVRQLFALALAYDLPEGIGNYGLDLDRLQPPRPTWCSCTAPPGPPSIGPRLTGASLPSAWAGASCKCACRGATRPRRHVPNVSPRA